jgi:putative CocE/NonD family hydrolase
MKTRKVRGAVAGLGLAYFFLYPGAIAFPQQAPLTHASAAAPNNSGYTVEQNVMVTMKDGTRLATDIYRPAKGSLPLPDKFPAIVYRTPYNKNSLHNDGIFFAQHGYVVVAQDCRGRFASGGEFYPFLNEGQDGYDTIEWAATQPWSNGKVGSAGASYIAWTQYTEAMLAPPHLDAMFPVVGASQFFPYPGGVPQTSNSLWILFMAQTSKEAEALPEVRATLEKTFKNPDPWFQLPPAQRGEILAKFPTYEKFFRDMYAHPTLDAYWKQTNFYPAGNYRRFKDVPMFFISGWYDGSMSVSGVIQNFVELSKLQNSPKKLMIGPWPHDSGKASCGEAYFGPSAFVDERALQLDWFNHWLKGEPLQIIGPAPIQIFRMGGGVADQQSLGKIQPGGKWISLQQWPPPGIRAVSFYLQPEGGLQESPAGSETSSSFEDDPAHPVPTLGGRFHNDCVMDQAPLEKRADVLSFTTPQLTAATEVTGDVAARFWVSSTAPDTDFVAKLSDVYPDGYSMILAVGQIRASYRNGVDHLSSIKPATIYQVSVDLGPTSNLFVPGHRIRLDISSTDFPRLEPNPNSGAFPGQWSHAKKARNTIYYGGPYPSSLILPVKASSDQPQ